MKREQPLTPAERKVVEAFAHTGFDNKRLASHVGLKHGTVKAHMGSAMSKANASTRAQLLLWWFGNTWTDRPDVKTR